jgi:hypothetical protein
MSVKEEEDTKYPVSGSLQNFPEFSRTQEALNAAQHSNSNLAADLNAVLVEERANMECGVRNWVGMLMGKVISSCVNRNTNINTEYRQSHRVGSGQPGEGVDFYEKIIGPPPHRFTCTVTIAETPEPLGHGVSFVVKKNAKRYAAKKAIDWLIENKYMPTDGNINFPKPAPVQQVPRARTPNEHITLGSNLAATSPTDRASPPLVGPSYASMVPELCYRLGFNPPSYVCTQQTPGLPMYDVHANFGPHPQIRGPVGQVHNVFGRRNAKEQSAKLSLVFLQDIEAKRHKREEEDDGQESDGESSNPSNESGEDEEEDEEN